MLTFDELNWIMAAEDSYERRDERNVTMARLHLYLPDSRISITTTAEDVDGTWQMLRFIQSRDPPGGKDAEICLSRYEFALLKGCLVSVMHQIVKAGGILEEAGGVPGDVHHVVHKIICPHCAPGGPLIEHAPYKLTTVGGDLVELPVDEVVPLAHEFKRQLGFHLDAHGEEILTPEELEEFWLKPEREREKARLEKEKEKEKWRPDLPDCSCDCLPQ